MKSLIKNYFHSGIGYDTIVNVSTKMISVVNMIN